RRRRTYARVLGELAQRDWSGRPLLMLWADPWNAGFQFEGGRRVLGSSLLAIPVVLERPPANTQVRIPAPLLPFRSTTQPDGMPSSPLWDNRRQEWQERSAPSSVWLRFQVPRELLPI